MSYRSFTDSTGVEWEAFDVVPQLAERRTADRRLSPQAIPFKNRRRSERRVTTGRRAVISGGMAGGWLCFDSGDGKRRLSPIPVDWARCSDERLEEYCRLARPVQRSASAGGSRPAA